MPGSRRFPVVALRGHEIPRMALDVLALLEARGGLPAPAIARGLSWPLDGDLRRLLARLRSEGYVSIYPGSGFTVTDRGRALLARRRTGADASTTGRP